LRLTFNVSLLAFRSFRIRYIRLPVCYMGCIQCSRFCFLSRCDIKSPKSVLPQHNNQFRLNIVLLYSNYLGKDNSETTNKESIAKRRAVIQTLRRQAHAPQTSFLKTQLSVLLTAVGNTYSYEQQTYTQKDQSGSGFCFPGF